MFYLTTHSTHFILWLYGVRHMAKDHSDSERGHPVSPHGLLFSIISKGSFICTNPHWLEGDIAQWVDPTTLRTMSERSYHGAKLPVFLKVRWSLHLIQSLCEI